MHKIFHSVLVIARPPHQINIPRQSREYFIDGHSPLLLAARVTSRWYGLSAAKVCYLPPVNGLRSSPWSVVLLPGPLPIDALSTQLSFVHSSPLYPHNILCTKTPGCGIYTLTPETFHRASGCFSLWDIPWNLIPQPLAVSPRACGYDPGILPLL